eukprot:TRINITY_DN16660_c0_g1_i1.p1 TRINITY_DN16660_c0_g1~~TRINITY_DN16660_c0_g1_i1.p1  ORF type:complete len:589 (+),score=213.84 TRINITY_DN16660_c0_g1_i1:70-1836(+)
MEAVFPSLADTDGPYSASLTQVAVQMALYGYVLFIAADMIGDGAEMLLLCPKYAGLVGSIVLPILGAVPDGMMVLCSGLGEPSEAQKEVAVGVGALAGSTIMLLTLPWFLSILSGRVTLNNGVPTYNKPESAPANWEKLDPMNKWNLCGTGVGIGQTLKKNAVTMLITSTSYFVIQGPALLVDKQAEYNTLKPAEQNEERKFESNFEHNFAWAGLFLCCFWFIMYLKQMFKESKNERGQVQEQIVKACVQGIQDGTLTLRGAMTDFRESTTELIKEDGGLEQGLLKINEKSELEVRKLCRLLVPFFAMYDENKDNKISLDEFRAIMRDVGERVGPETERRIFESADTDKNGWIEYEEFVVCMMAFALAPKDSFVGGGKDEGRRNSAVPQRLPTASAYMKDAKPEDDQEEPEEEDMPADLAGLDPEEQQRRVKQRAFQSMFVGSVLVLLFSDPMCDMLGLFADKIGIKKFYVSFLLAPLASNASELVSAMKLAQKRTLSSMVQSLSTLEGAAIMNNTFCLAIFLILIVWKKLAWQFSAETLSIVLIQIIIAIFVLSKKVQTLLDGMLILCLYPAALLIVWFLEEKMHLD